MKMKCPAYPRQKRDAAALMGEEVLVLRTGMGRLYRPIADTSFDDLIARFK